MSEMDSLIMAQADSQQHREWARQRAKALNEMRILEQQLNIGDAE